MNIVAFSALRPAFGAVSKKPIDGATTSFFNPNNYREVFYVTDNEADQYLAAKTDLESVAVDDLERPAVVTRYNATVKKLMKMANDPENA